MKETDGSASPVAFSIRTGTTLTKTMVIRRSNYYRDFKCNPTWNYNGTTLTKATGYKVFITDGHGVTSAEVTTSNFLWIADN
mgnify:CR=1 FL=1